MFSAKRKDLKAIFQISFPPGGGADGDRTRDL